MLPWQGAQIESAVLQKALVVGASCGRFLGTWLLNFGVDWQWKEVEVYVAPCKLEQAEAEAIVEKLLGFVGMLLVEPFD